jgi:hypothetical protein
MLPEIENLREIARRCQAGEPLDADLSRWLGASLEDFLQQRCHSVDEAFGLRSARGGVAWRQEAAIHDRNATLRALAGQVCPESSPSARARQVHTLAIRYAATCWRRDRDLDEMPPRYRGTPKVQLWRAFKAGAAMPIGKRHLRSILAG